MAGVFTVVGLLAFAFIFMIVTTAIRRRRAQKFDRDLAEAAATNPNYPPIDDEGVYTGYSEGSNGAYSQPPMSYSGENYNMADMAPYAGYGAIGGGVAGAAVAGAAVNHRNRRDSRLTEGTQYTQPGIAGFGAGNHVMEEGHQVPYGAFAGPTQGVDEYNTADPFMARGPSVRYRPQEDQGQDLIDAAGVGAAATGLARGPSHGANLQRNKSGATSNWSGGSGSRPPESYSAHYQPNFNPDQHQPAQGAYDAYLGGDLSSNTHADASPEAGALENSSEEGLEPHHGISDGNEVRLSMQDDEDYARPRTLRVSQTLDFTEKSNVNS